MNARTLETLVTEALTAKQADLHKRVFGKRHGLTHDDYVRLNGEWWGLEDAKNEVQAVVKKADI